MSAAPVPPPAAAADFEQAMRQFREEFAASLPARFAQAQDCLAACRRNPQDQAALQELHRVVHRLAGSAGTFGMRALGDAARVLEDRLEDLLARPDRDAADFDPVQQDLQQVLSQQPGQA